MGAHSLPIEQVRTRDAQGITTFGQMHILCHQCDRRRGRHCALIALSSRAFGSSMRRCGILMMPLDFSCSTWNRILFVLLCWPLSMRPRQHDRFVLIGLGWLYGLSKFPPPPHAKDHSPHSMHKTFKRDFSIRAFGRATSQQSAAQRGGDARDPPPCSQRNIDISKLKFAEKTSRLMSPFSKDETGHES